MCYEISLSRKINPTIHSSRKSVIPSAKSFPINVIPLNDIHRQHEERGHEGHDQGQPGPVGEDGETEGGSRNQEQEPVESSILFANFHQE